MTDSRHRKPHQTPATRYESQAEERQRRRKIAAEAEINRLAIEAGLLPATWLDTFWAGPINPAALKGEARMVSMLGPEPDDE